MKRFCYLLTILLTGFSIVANKTSNCNTYLATALKTGELHAVNLETQTSFDNPITTSEASVKPFFSQTLARCNNFISSAKN